MSDNANNVHNNSLRTIVKDNTDAMHNMSSRFGEVTAVRNSMAAFKGDLENQIGGLFGGLEALASGNVKVNESIKQIKEFFKTEMFKVGEKLARVEDRVDDEVIAGKKVEKKLEELDTKLTNYSKWRKGYKVALGVLLLALVGCLGYLDYKLDAVSVVVEKQKIQAESQTSSLKPFKVKKDSALLPVLSKPVVKGRKKHRNKHLDRLRFYKS
ncbi:MAG: hypothetical protein HYR87_07550 [Thaumarchaeota archaeon]|nr:hypothetical protein [Nitrososphaerota archaeon]